MNVFSQSLKMCDNVLILTIPQLLFSLYLKVWPLTLLISDVGQHELVLMQYNKTDILLVKPKTGSSFTQESLWLVNSQQVNNPKVTSVT